MVSWCWAYKPSASWSLQEELGALLAMEPLKQALKMRSKIGFMASTDFFGMFRKQETNVLTVDRKSVV